MNKIVTLARNIIQMISTYWIDFVNAGVPKKIWRVISIALMLIGAVASIISIYQFFSQSDARTSELYRIGKNYYFDKEYNESLKAFIQVYKTDKDFPDVKYYYTMCLLMQNSEESKETAYKVLYSDRERLTQNELALYACLEHDKGNYAKAISYFEKIDDPIYLDIQAFNNYILSSTDSYFKQDFGSGLNSLNDNLVLIDRKINTLGDLPEEIYRLEGAAIRINPYWVFPEDKPKIKGVALQLINIGYDECREKEDYVNLIPLLKMGSKHFSVFAISEDKPRSYLACVYDFMSIATGLTKNHIRLLDEIFTDIIGQLETANTQVWGDDLNKCILLQKSLSEKTIIPAE